MPKRPIESLGALVKARRGQRKLRETALTVGISAPTLMRIENGRMPDLTTFGKVCSWLEIDPKEFLGGSASKADGPNVLTVSAHFRADKNPRPETIKALAQMILVASQMQPPSNLSTQDDI